MDAVIQDAVETMERQLADVIGPLSASMAPIFEEWERQSTALQPILEGFAAQAEWIRSTVQSVEELHSGLFYAEPWPVIAPAVVTAPRIEPRRETVVRRTTILPPAARWDDVRIEFVDERNVNVFHRNKMIGSFDWQELGFARKNTTDARPSKPWILLLHLSIFSGYEGAKPTIGKIGYQIKDSRSTLQKRKQLLSSQLRAAFGIADDPFLQYDATEGYRTKFALKAPRSLRNEEY